MGSSLSFCVSVLSYNHPQITSRCVSSVLRFVPPQQVILVHNGTESRHREALVADFPHVHHEIIPVNKGYSGGANHALQVGLAKHKWVLFLTNDTELLSLSENPSKPGIYSPLVYFRKLDRIDYCGGLFDSSRARLIHIKNVEPIQRKPGQFHYVPGTAFFIDQETYQTVGGFDESLHTYWEDVDWGARASNRGIHFGFLPELKLLHAGGKTNRKDPFYTNYLFQKNRRRVSWRHCPWYLKPRLLWHLGRNYRPLSK